MKRLKKIRREKNISVADIAKKAGISRMAIYYYEQGKKVPSASIAIKIANALQTTVEELMR